MFFFPITPAVAFAENQYDICYTCGQFQISCEMLQYFWRIYQFNMMAGMCTSDIWLNGNNMYYEYYKHCVSVYNFPKFLS